ncbi:hypothetical protein L207DRAFT_630078 [Hyaloscypha variabilis F]|uniref:BTB domain-containing protein n=1 Tax=Hyaloscypha variabilis (strain UAMH 11265 / GT02V1 / F) TaxID=1149755 RepID=A0A2J6S4L7_HYAVF|nr:hypothetical protein L207DRAFT_630078 [Hyaloscypha variabilis F]
MAPNERATPAVDGAADAPRRLRPSEENMAETTSYIDGIGTEMVDIYVGPSKKRFRLYKAKLCTRIPYFDKMFNGTFKEASDNVAYLEEDNPASFDLLADWANHPTTSNSPRWIRELTTIEGKEGNEVASWDPVGFYSLAEKYCLPELQDIIMDVLIQYHKVRNELPSVDFVIRAYKHTSTGSLLTRYCAESIFYVMENATEDDRWSTEEVAPLFRELPTFASEYISVQRKRGIKGAVDPRDASPCHFHTHGRDEPCAGNPKKRKSPGGERCNENKRPRMVELENFSDAVLQDFDFDSFLRQ